MIRIGGQPADPTEWLLWETLSEARQEIIQAHMASRSTSYEWATAEEFRAWAREEIDATAPTEREIDEDELDRAQGRKRSYEMAMNSVPLVSQIGAQAPFDRSPMTHLPNFDFHFNAPQDTFYAHGRSGHLGLFQMNSAAEADDNDERRERSEITLYTEPTTQKVHAHTNVGDDLIHSVVDTSANRSGSGPPPTKKRKLTDKDKGSRGFRDYGGHSNKDFQTADYDEDDDGIATMRGHGVGYADTIPKPTAEIISLTGKTKPYPGHVGYRMTKKKNGTWGRGTEIPTSMTSNDNPRCYYPESDSGKGEDLGAKVKNHAHEAATREHGGTYVQSSSYASDDTELSNGMLIPNTNHYLRDKPGDTHPYASFTTGEELHGDADDEWTSHARTTPYPAPKYWAPSSPLSSLFPSDSAYTFAPSTPNFMDDAYVSGEEDMDEELPLHKQQTAANGTHFMPFEKRGDQRYYVGRFLPTFSEPEKSDHTGSSEEEESDEMVAEERSGDYYGDFYGDDDIGDGESDGSDSNAGSIDYPDEEIDDESIHVESEDDDLSLTPSFI